MGITNVNLQAMPADSKMLELAKTDYRIISWIWHLKDVKEGRRFYPKSYHPEGEEEFKRLASQVLQDNSGIEERYYSSVRMPHQIYNSLQIRDIRKNIDLGYIAINGEEPLFFGEPTFYNSPSTVNRIVIHLNSITRDEMQERFDSIGEKKRIANFGLDSPQDRIWSEFTELRDTYISASEHNEAILVRQI